MSEKKAILMTYAELDDIEAKIKELRSERDNLREALEASTEFLEEERALGSQWYAKAPTHAIVARRKKSRELCDTNRALLEPV